MMATELCRCGHDRISHRHYGKTSGCLGCRTCLTEPLPHKYQRCECEKWEQLSSTVEEWRGIPSCPGYEASNLGNIRSVHRQVHYADKRIRSYPSVELKPHIDRHGYKKDLHVLHRNGNPSDNRLENLYYGTDSDNLHDAVRHGVHVHANKTHCPYGHEFTPDNIYWCGRRGPF